jgi:hypothetical protein
MARRKKQKTLKALRRLWKPAAWLLAVVLLAAGGWFGSRAAWSALAGRPEFRIDAMLELDNCPPWVRAGPMSWQLRQALRGEPCGRSLFDPDAARAVAARLRQSPWVLDVLSVERRLPNSLRVGLTFRKPAGVVWMKTNRKRYMVDCDGHWLPDDLFRERAEWSGVHLPVIEDRTFAELPGWEGPWNGPRYAVGARLTEFFLREHLLDRLHVSVIDVTGVGRTVTEPDVILTVPWVRDDGEPDAARVVWGKSVFYEGLEGLEAPLLVTPDDEKLNMLMTEVAAHPGLKGVRRLKLQFAGQSFLSPAE